MNDENHIKWQYMGELQPRSNTSDYLITIPERMRVKGTGTLEDKYRLGEDDQVYWFISDKNYISFTPDKEVIPIYREHPEYEEPNVPGKNDKDGVAKRRPHKTSMKTEKQLNTEYVYSDYSGNIKKLSINFVPQELKVQRERIYHIIREWYSGVGSEDGYVYHILSWTQFSELLEDDDSREKILSDEGARMIANARCYPDHVTTETEKEDIIAQLNVMENHLKQFL